jgi:hypothetical protein
VTRLVRDSKIRSPHSCAREVSEIIADNLSKAGWSLGWVSALNVEGRTIWIADAHRDNRKRFIVRADEKLTVFVEPKSAIRAGGRVDLTGW